MLHKKRWRTVSAIEERPLSLKVNIVVIPSYVADR